MSKESRTYYRAVFNQDAETTIDGKILSFQQGETFVNKMSEKNLQAFLSDKQGVKLMKNSIVKFPTSYFDIYKITETITFEEEKINPKDFSLFKEKLFIV